MTPSTIEIMNKGMQCLTEQMGIVDAERFISLIIREKFDYTQWQKQLTEHLGTAVRIAGNKMSITFRDEDELNRLIEHLLR